MPTVHHRTARKDYPNDGIEKGDKYFYTSMKTGPRSSRVMRSKTPFRRSQLTTSEYLSQLYEIQDSVDILSEPEDVREFVEQLQTLAEEQGERFDAMPEGLQQGDTGQMLEARRDACQEAADQIESTIDGLPEEPELADGADPDQEIEYGDAMMEYESACDDAMEEIKSTVGNLE